MSATPSPSRVKALCQQVGMKHGVTSLDILSPSRRRQVYRARREVIHHLRDAGFGLSGIGRGIGRDHTSVRHALRERAE